MAEKIEWEGYYDRHAWLDNGLHLRVTRIDPFKSDPFWIWTVHDPMVRPAVAASEVLGYPVDQLDRAEQDCIEAARRITPYGS